MQDLKFCICGKIIKKADKYCDKCKSKLSKKISERNKYYDEHNRDIRSKTFYNSIVWKKLVSVAKQRDNGVCVLCLSNGVISKGTIVHHIVPIRDDWNKRLAITNCITLCYKCHGLVHYAYDKSKKSKEEMQEYLKSLNKKEI